jgi:hypothetical protein
MLKTTTNLIEGIHELEDLMMKEIGTDIIEDMDSDQFVLLKKAFELMKTSEELMLKQAETFESMNNKLDRLLEKMETES